ncbi:MAG: hypothetical protein ACLTAS_14250 [Butyribacter sp.]
MDKQKIYRKVAAVGRYFAMAFAVVLYIWYHRAYQRYTLMQK